jgi:hypothetical protein
MEQQIEIRFPIPGVDNQGPALFGSLCPSAAEVPLDIYRYLKDTSGRQTTYIKREKGRPVNAIAADLHAIIAGMDYEWATLGQAFKYGVGKLTPETECPEHSGVCVYARHGGSEGHIVCIELILQPKHGEPGGDGSAMLHMCLFMVKTFNGAAGAGLIADKLAKALGVY